MTHWIDDRSSTFLLLLLCTLVNSQSIAVIPSHPSLVMSDDPSPPPAKKGPSDDGHSTPLKPAISAVVSATNHLLSNLHDSTESVRRPVLKGLETVDHEASYLVLRARNLYQRRHEFGPPLIVTSALLVGGTMALRRGRVSGALAGTLAGSLAYIGIYENIRMDGIPDIIFGKRES